MDRLAQMLQQVEDEISRIPDYEVGFVFRPNGDLVLKKIATDDNLLALPFSDEERAHLPGCVFTHNHPGHGSSLSPEDIKFAFANRLWEIRAVSGKYVYRLHSAKGQFDPDDFDRIITPVYDREKNVIGPLIHSALQAGHLSPLEADEKWPHDLWVKLVQEIGLPYERLERQSGDQP